MSEWKTALPPGPSRRGIAWTGVTWNGIIGCDRCTTECLRCYAEDDAGGMVRKTHGNTPYADVVRRVGDDWRWTGVVRRNSESAFYKMRALRGYAARAAAGLVPRQRVFVNSMSDLFHPDAVKHGLTRTMVDELLLNPGHDYQILTKRAELAAEYYASDLRIHDHPDIWMGVSCGIVASKYKIDILRGIPARKRMLSLEPLLEDLGDLDLTGIHWVIAGGESREGCRGCRGEWLRRVRDQCVERSVPFFLKQLGGHPDKRAHEKAVLDGRTWTEFPR